MDRIPLPQVRDFLYDEFMLPMNIDAHTLAKGANIPLDIVQSILADTQEITPEISEKLGAYFGVSSMLFYDIQQDIYSRNAFPELQYA